MFGSPEVSYHQNYSARDWLSILRTPHPTQNLQRKHGTDLQNNNNNNNNNKAIFFNIITYFCSRVVLENLTGSQLVKKFSAFYGTRKFITAFTSAHQLSLS